MIFMQMGLLHEVGSFPPSPPLSPTCTLIDLLWGPSEEQFQGHQKPFLQKPTTKRLCFTIKEQKRTN